MQWGVSLSINDFLSRWGISKSIKKYYSSTSIWGGWSRSTMDRSFVSSVSICSPAMIKVWHFRVDTPTEYYMKYFTVVGGQVTYLVLSIFSVYINILCKRGICWIYLRDGDWVVSWHMSVERLRKKCMPWLISPQPVLKSTRFLESQGMGSDGSGGDSISGFDKPTSKKQEQGGKQHWFFCGPRYIWAISVRRCVFLWRVPSLCQCLKMSAQKSPDTCLLRDFQAQLSRLTSQ